MAAAMVVLPTPPLPIVMTTPCPSAQSRRSARAAGRPLAAGGRRSAPRAASDLRIAAIEDARERVDAERRRTRAAVPRSRAARSSAGSMVEASADARSSASAIGSSRSVALKSAVDDEPLVADAERGKLAAGSLGFGKRRRSGRLTSTSVVAARRRGPRGCLVERALGCESGERAEAGGAGRVRRRGSLSRPRQAEQAQRVPGRRGVEDRRGRTPLSLRARRAGERTRRRRRSQAVQAPESCSSMLATAASGSTSR